MLAREAEALVLAHDTAGGFLEDPAVVDPADIAGADEPRSRARASAPTRSSARSVAAAWGSSISRAI